MSAPECVFCGIVARRVEASIVAESPAVIAIMDINPVTTGHVLVLPKAHLQDLADLADPLAAEMLALARRIAAALRESPLPVEGINLFYADGGAAGQEVFHAHLHVIPRSADDGFIVSARWDINPTRAQLDADAAEIAAHL